MKTNNTVKPNPVFTHEGGAADKINNYLQLRRSVLSTMLWEDSFYEDGVSVSERIAALIPKVKPQLVSDLAIEARSSFNLRHIPLFICVEMVKHDSHRPFVADTIYHVIQRADEPGELLSLYWIKGKCPIANQVKKGLARSLTKFNEYSLRKYSGKDKTIKLKDVLFLTHAKPLDKEQEALWKRLIDNKLEIADTWETELSKNGNNKASWERLLSEGKLGIMALLRNLRNFKVSGVNENLIREYFDKVDTARALPFRFIAAAKYYPSLEDSIEKAMLKNLNGSEKLGGNTALVIDVSGSMDMSKISAKSELTRMEAANALAILFREQCQNVNVITFSKTAVEVPNRRGFALRDAIVASQPHKDTFINPAIALINKGNYDRVIVLTDGQIQDAMQNINCDNKFMINVANYQNGIGYKNGFINIDGFSEAVVNYLVAIDKEKTS